MNLHFTLAGYILFANTVLCLLLAFIVWTRRVKPGGKVFGWLMLSLAVWSFMAALEDGSLDYAFKITCSKLSYLGIATSPALLLVFALAYSRQVNWLKPYKVALLWIIPIISLGMAMTNEKHLLLWSSIIPSPGTNGAILIYNHGIYFWIHVVFSYVCLLTSTVLLARAALMYPRQFRHQGIIFLIAILIPMVGNIIYVFGLSPIPGLDITPLSFTFMSCLIAWSIFRNQLFGLVPIVRDLVVENMPGGVMILDSQHCIIDINPAAVKMFRKDGEVLWGRPVGEVFAKNPALLKKFLGAEEGQDEIMLEGEPPRNLDMRIKALRDEWGKINGRLFLLHDITQLKKIENDERKQRKLAEALSDSAAALNSIRDLNDLLDRILLDVSKVVPSDAASFGMVDKNRFIRFVRTRGYRERGLEKQIKSLHFSIDEVASFREMASTGKPVVITNTREDPNWVSTQNADWVRSYAGAPIMMADELLGFLNLDSAKENFFTEENGQQLKAFADQAAVAFHNIRLFEQVRRNAEEMRFLYQISTSLSSGLDLHKVVRELYEQCQKIVDVSMFYLALYDEKTGEMKFQSYNQNGDVLRIKPRNIRTQPGITGHIILERKTVYIADIFNPKLGDPVDRLIQIRGDRGRTYLGLPLKIRNRVIGVLSLQSESANAYRPEDIRLLETIAVQASIAIENARLFDEMEKQAITDGLTGLFNHRYFSEISEKEMARSLRYKKPLSVIMIDLDHFKTVNDRFGHIIGDQLLQLIAHNCGKTLRKIDILSRYGGEEFVVLLPETDLKDALAVAERLQQAIEATSLVTADGVVKITASLGVAPLEKDDTDIRSLINRADKALYAAKDAGRNCVVAYHANLESPVQ